MKAIGLVRLGRDSELRELNDGNCVLNFAAAYNYGKKGDDGKRPTQWVDCALWGERARKAYDWLVKGKQLVVYLRDIHVETYEGQNGFGAKLVGQVEDFEMVSDGSGQAQQPAQQQQPRQAAQPQRQVSAPRGAPAPRQSQAAPAQRQAPAPQSSGFDDMDDDIPFISCSMAYDMTTSKQRKMAKYDY